MFRNFLKSTKECIHIKLAWMKKINGLIRVIICEPDNKAAYVVVYYEQNNKYTLNAFCPISGQLFWSVDVPNGGYGSPAIVGNCIVILTGFTNIAGICKYSGNVLWTFNTHTRIRSSINIVKNKIYFSSGGTLFELNEKGELSSQWSYPKAFFYGSVDVINELIISLGVINDDSSKSLIKVFAFHRTGKTVYELPITHGVVISTDTSGIFWQKNVGFIGAENLITAFKGVSGEILWTSRVDGCAGRQVCTVDDERVYYVTQAGNIGALSIVDGAHLWKIQTQDFLIVSPISVAGDVLIVSADAHLLVLKAANGQLLQKIPVGHSPYSMISLNNEIALLGAGEPPHNGLLYGFKLEAKPDLLKYNCVVQTSNTNIENSFFDLIVEVHNAEEPIIEAQLHGAMFYMKEEIKGVLVQNFIYSFRIAIPKNMSPGEFVIPLSLILESENVVTRPIAISLKRRKPLPNRVYLDHIPDIVQEKPLYSGAAIASIIKSMNGDNMSSQKDIREMVDAVRDLSGYEAFQIWRIILRRVLTSQANNTEQLPEISSFDLVDKNK